MQYKILDLYCGAGGSAVGLYRAGFFLYGVDIVPQSNYPFEFTQADALTVSLEGYDAYWASPECYSYSTLRGKHQNKIYPNDIEPIRRRLIATNKPYIIENVIGAPLANPIMLCGTMFSLKVFRHRLFESNIKLAAPEHRRHNATSKERFRTKHIPEDGYVTVVGHFGFPMSYAEEAMGIDWMSRKEIVRSIPPAYSEYLGHQLMQYLEDKSASCRCERA